MRIDGDSLSTAPLVPLLHTCAWCGKRQPFHDPSCGSHDASLNAKVAELLIAASLVSPHVIPAAAPAADGSSLTRRGAGGSRSWSVTGSSGSVCRRLRLVRSGSTSGRGTSAGGTATGRTSDSSRSSSVEDDIIGTARDVDDCQFGWMGTHYWDRPPFGSADDVKCLMCGRTR